MKKICKKIGTVLIAISFFVTALYCENVYADTNKESVQYKYIMFADKINLDSKHVVVNGNYIEKSAEPMIDKQRSIIKEFILNNAYHNNKYSDEMITLREISNFNVGCVQDINIEQDTINTDSVLYSENGNVNINATNVNFQGLIYAPTGTISITGKNVNLNAILIAKEITVHAENFTANENQEMASFLGTESDTYCEVHDIYTYSYDIFNHITSIDIGERNLVKYTYKDSFISCLESEKYANGTSVNYLENFEDSDNQGESALEQYISETSIETSKKESGNTIYYDYSVNDLNQDAEENVEIVYDLNKNNAIENIKNEENDISYIYDNNKQLVRADDKNLDRTFLYSYDSRGNIISKQEYLYSEEMPTTIVAEDNYGYDNDWKDSLTSYNGENILTDEIGNPLLYKGWTLSWEAGNQLKTATNKQHNLSFDYDDFGLRMSKSDNGRVTTYKYIDRNIVEQNNGLNKLTFKYDDDFNIVGVNIDGTDYFYEKNIQNDVVKILDTFGNVVVEYAYDPWGRVEMVTGDLSNTVGYLNPIRYRSYYYDNETEMYYLLSRYYDPDTGRFINADDFDYLACDNNLFKYCNNDPVNFIDKNGHLSWNGGTPVINSGYDYQEYESLITTAKNTLKTLGFTGIDRGKAIDYLSTTHTFSIRSFNRRVHFLSQCAIESEWGLYTTEYGSRSYFANKPYGYKYRGGGYIQLTWDYNYQSFSDYVGDSNVYSQGADYVGENYAWKASGWFWMNNRINTLIDNGASVKEVTKIVNGGYSKLEEREAAYNKIKKLL